MSTGVLITARLKSTRLPKKVLRPILGKPMLELMVDRLKRAEAGGTIVLCTSTVKQDDPLEEIAADLGIGCYRGHPDDVLLRITRAAAEWDLDTVVSCTADNPLIDPEQIDRLVEFHLRHHNDYSRTEGLPIGTFSYVLSRDAMERACAIKDDADTEIWGGYFTKTGVFRAGVRQVEPEVNRPDLRLTVDTPEDFELVRRVFEAFHDRPDSFGVAEIAALCDRHPEWLELNRHVEQKAAPPVKLRRGF